MPRDFDSDAVARGRHRLEFVENLDCPRCGQVFEGLFGDDSMTVEDIVDPPVGQHTCPACGHCWRTHLTGWIFFSEAG